MDIKIEKQDQAVVVKPVGEIDLHSSPQLRQVMREVIDGDKGNLLIDLAGVNYMDSSGLATLVEAFQQITKKGRKLMLYALTDPVKNILSITRLDEIFSVFGSQEEVLKEMSKA